MSLEGTRVMIADDERVIRRMVAVKLAGLGCEVVEVADGQEVLTSLRSGEVPDVLVTDRMMPRVDGLELVRALRSSQDPSLARLPVIMLTSKQGEQDVIDGLEAGLDDYMVKPFSPGELAARVRAVLWRSAGRSS